jgi:hypothetical protein
VFIFADLQSLSSCPRKKNTHQWVDFLAILKPSPAQGGYKKNSLSGWVFLAIFQTIITQGGYKKLPPQAGLFRGSSKPVKLSKK